KSARLRPALAELHRGDSEHPTFKTRMGGNFDRLPNDPGFRLGGGLPRIIVSSLNLARAPY
ncbi:MAG: hypothetical protein ACI8RZ_006745, partial [Myxococcota bacterium]